MYQIFEHLLTESDLTISDVSRATGIRMSVFSNWKARGGNLSVDNLAKVARFFGVPIERFLSDKEARSDETCI